MEADVIAGEACEGQHLSFGGSVRYRDLLNFDSLGAISLIVPRSHVNGQEPKVERRGVFDVIADDPPNVVLAVELICELAVGIPRR